MRAALRRQVNLTGVARVPDITATEIDGHILDGFWSLRLRNLLPGYSVVEGSELEPVATGTFFVQTSDYDEPFPELLQRLVVMMATFNILRIAILNLAVNFRARSGPAEYEQQASATTLRAILQSMEDELGLLVETGTIGSGLFVYFDGVLQARYAELAGLPALTVIV